MRRMRKGLAVLLALLLLLPSFPTMAEEPLGSDVSENDVSENDVSVEEELPEDRQSEEEQTGEQSEEKETEEKLQERAAEVYFNLGNYNFGIVSPENYKEGDCDENGVGYECFQEDGSYTIDITALTGEKNPFFPYEVQFIYAGGKTKEWFMTPD